MTTIKRISCLISFLFFCFSTVVMGVYDSWTGLYAILGIFLSIFFLGLFFYIPKIEKIEKIIKTNDLSKRYYLSLMPTSWPDIKRQLYLHYLQKIGITIDPKSTFIPLKKEELALLLQKDPQKLWVKELIIRISQMSPIEARSQLREPN